MRINVFRFLTLTFLFVVVASTVQAYTIVLRSGRQIEIPPVFSVTDKTLTFETSPGIQMTLQLAAIDVPATERANREDAGSFRKLLQRNRTNSQPVPDVNQPQVARTTITNKDLESYARARKQSELAYERRRKELGLPSAAESRRREIADEEAGRRRSELNRADESSRESYWRERATTLRSEIAEADAEISVVREQIAAMPATNNFNSVSVLGGPAFPLMPFGTPVVNSVFQSRVTSLGNRIQFGSYPIVQPGYYSRWPRSGFRRPDFYNQYPLFPTYGPSGYPAEEFSYERTTLVNRLNELVAQRARLQVRWQLLEEEARRAGAYPGWLRP